MMVQDLLAILPMMDDLILLDVSGEMIHKVSKLLILIQNTKTCSFYVCWVRNLGTHIYNLHYRPLHSTKYIYIISLFKASWYPLSLLQSRKFYFHNKTVQWIFEFVSLLNVLHLFIGNNGPKIYNLLAPDKLMTTPVRIYSYVLVSGPGEWCFHVAQTWGKVSAGKLNFDIHQSIFKHNIDAIASSI